MNKSRSLMKEKNTVNYDEMILADGVVTTFNSLETGLNNNTIVLGATGSGKSMSVTEPQIMHTFNNSLVVTLSKRKIADQYEILMRSRGYRVEILDLTNPDASMVGFDPLEYIKDENDILAIARQIVYTSKYKGVNRDPYWDEAAISMVAAEIAALVENWVYEKENVFQAPRPTIENLIKLHSELRFFESERSGFTISSLDTMFERLQCENAASYAAQCWRTVKGLASKTVSCINSTVNVGYTQVFSPKVREVARKRPLDIEQLGKQKSVLFIITSPVDKSANMYCNMLYATIFKLLFEQAEANEDYRLEVPVHLICDDFACGSTIPDFGEYISIIRSAGISVSLLIQSETQLDQIYGLADATTIRNNCDRLIYLGGTDISTCNSIARRANVPFDMVYGMPLEKVYVFERGKKPVCVKRYQTMKDPVWLMMHDRNAEEVR